MCGIFGAIGDHNVRDDGLTGLAGLVHRGEEATGILTLDEQRMYSLRKVGDLSRLLDEAKDIGIMRGNMFLGHLRYSTTGEKGNKHSAQPFFLDAAQVGLVHNGQVENMEALETILKAKNSRLLSDSDSEQLLALFVAELTECSTAGVFAAAKAVQTTAIGGYSCILTIRGVGMLAFKDPWGFMPLVMAEKQTEEGKAVVFSSEDVAFTAGRYTNKRELRNGEVVLVTPDLRVHSEVSVQGRKSKCAFQSVYFGAANSEIDGTYNRDARYELGKILAERMQPVLEGVDLVVPVPNTPIAAAEGFSDATSIQMRMGIEKRGGRIFITPDQAKRMEKAELAFRYDQHMFRDKSVAVIDDSIVRGTNMSIIVRRLREVGAREVHVGSTWPPVKHACNYGIDMHVRELMAVNRTIEACRDYLGADSLTYNTTKDIVHVLGGNICMACVTGEYPTTLYPLQVRAK